MGYKNVSHYAEGLESWRRAGGSVHAHLSMKGGD
jgi:rhodanese-related sulfurtransferase